VVSEEKRKAKRTPSDKRVTTAGANVLNKMFRGAHFISTLATRNCNGSGA